MNLKRFVVLADNLPKTDRRRAIYQSNALSFTSQKWRKRVKHIPPAATQYSGASSFKSALNRVNSRKGEIKSRERQPCI